MSPAQGAGHVPCPGRWTCPLPRALGMSGCERAGNPVRFASMDHSSETVTLPVPDYDADDVMVVKEPEQLRALGGDLRKTIVVRLRESACSTSELAAELGIPKGTVGHHLKVLARAGL